MTDKLFTDFQNFLKQHPDNPPAEKPHSDKPPPPTEIKPKQPRQQSMKSKMNQLNKLVSEINGNYEQTNNKPKRTMSTKQLENLAKGRENAKNNKLNKPVNNTNIAPKGHIVITE
jgi:hypothetical protein